VSRRAVALWGPLVVALACVFWLSSLSSVPGASFVWDKLLHAGGYAVIGLLTLRAFHGGIMRPRLWPATGSGLFILAWGISDEFHQSTVPGRDASAGDVVADVVGFAIACAVLLAWTGWKRRLRASADVTRTV
jgi:VanZ family protein